ncbi:hypothetical protein FB565_007090 [Actinoplanes lutulentus]|uniref:Glycosyl hydrolase family 43 n=1 Tax=Actinoplanes lutulentus TaxID=1287878 RepID=A0A327ZAA8_9ACTN|nr:glycoside hydrolase family 43 protein [Actinoplanes lutulentus]MBB2947322.1 hypothetical protein [Actinoplanes lutulentus]RAK36597.1 hypothetical protein B0I29_108187 [Actinoplanes lutulentus]
MSGAYLLVYFKPEFTPDGEQVRFAVSGIDDPTTWTELNGGQPILVSDVGERGVRDPFLIRDTRTGRFIVIGTDLRVFPDQDWKRATRSGSRSVVVWESADLISWSRPALVEVSPPGAGNTWAPKAFWSPARAAWLMIWASALYDDAESPEQHQRLLAAQTGDFRAFTPAEIYHDPGHTVIDATFLADGDDWYRFSADSLGAGPTEGRGEHILMERGTALEDPAYVTVVEDIGKPELRHAEGPAVFAGPSGDCWYLLIDENGHRGYQLYRTDVLASGRWERQTSAVLPVDARHGSVLPITLAERERLLHAFTAQP